MKHINHPLYTLPARARMPLQLTWGMQGHAGACRGMQGHAGACPSSSHTLVPTSVRRPVRPETRGRTATSTSQGGARSLWTASSATRKSPSR